MVKYSRCFYKERKVIVLNEREREGCNITFKTLSTKIILLYQKLM